MLLADNATQFWSHTLDKFCKSYNIILKFVPKYYPASNLVERHYRVLKSSLAICCSKNQRYWDYFLPYVTFSLNITKNQSTGYSPSRLFLTRELRVPFDPGPRSMTMREFDVNDYLDYITKDQTLILENVQHIVEKELIRSLKRYNANRREVTYRKNDLVLKRIFAQSDAFDFRTHKLEPKYEGPVVITELVSPTQVYLRTLENEDLGLWHVSHLKPFLE